MGWVKLTQLERFNRHFEKPFHTLEAFKTELEALYKKEKSSNKAGKAFGGVTGRTILTWLEILNIPKHSKGGPNNKNKGVAHKINEMDQAKLHNLTSHEIGQLVGCTGRYIQFLKTKGKIKCSYKKCKKGELDFFNPNDVI